MNLTKTLTKLSLLLAIAFIVSCSDYRYIYYDRVESPKIKKIMLMGVALDNKTSREIQRVHYPSSSFILENFTDGLVEGFNQNEFGVELALWDNSAIHEKILSKNQVPLVYAVSKNDEKALALKSFIGSRKVFAYRKYFNADHLLALELTVSAWEQDVRGFLKVYNRRGKVVWREELKHQSPYIHNDVESPYRSRNFRVQQPPVDSDSDHYQEMNKTFYELGKTVAESLLVTLTKIKNL